jgi:NAD(P)-dependent dehydrogenase (short-subunit alcohol dehydrogenase family)
MPTAIITGASRGLGLALARALDARGWRLVLDARGADALAAATSTLTNAVALPGDVADPKHRSALVALAGPQIDLLVNNASILGPSPQPELAQYPIEVLEEVYRVNTIAPLALTQLALPHVPDGGTIINVTSDAGIEAYDGWGGYGSSKAAFEQWTAVLGVERPHLRIYAVDPGDMRTQMHQAAFPEDDISDRPLPEESIPAFLALLDGQLQNGRYRAHDLLPVNV